MGNSPSRTVETANNGVTSSEHSHSSRGHRKCEREAERQAWRAQRRADHEARRAQRGGGCGKKSRYPPQDVTPDMIFESLNSSLGRHENSELDGQKSTSQNEHTQKQEPESSKPASAELPPPTYEEVMVERLKN